MQTVPWCCAQMHVLCLPHDGKTATVHWTAGGRGLRVLRPVVEVIKAAPDSELCRKKQRSQ